ncbi:MAG: MFS transporter [Chloroflexi bacterium]|nr:MFS transporter [Chloroflexota bacterium]
MLLPWFKGQHVRETDSRARAWAGSTFAALAVRDFRYLWLGNFASQIGVWIQMIAQGWLAYDLTGSATFLGAVAVARAVPSLILTLPSGVLADRLDRRWMILSSQTLSMVNAAALAWLVGTGTIAPWHLLAGSFLTGASHSLNMPARQALGPQLAGARHLANAVALNSISFNTSRVLGPSIAGVLVGVLGLSSCFVVQAVGQAWAIAWTLAIRSSGRASSQPQRGSIWTNLVDGIRYMAGSRAITGLMIVAAVPILLGMVYIQLMPVFARDVLGIGPSGLAMLMSAVGVGSMAGAFLAAALSNHDRKGRILVASSVAFGVGIALFAVSPTLQAALVALALVGAAQAIALMMNQTLLNLITPNEYRGRMMSVYMMTWNIEPAVFLPAGWLTDTIGAPPVALLSGTLVVITVLVIATRLREIHEVRPATASAAVGHRDSPAPALAVRDSGRGADHELLS